MKGPGFCIAAADWFGPPDSRLHSIVPDVEMGGFHALQNLNYVSHMVGDTLRASCWDAPPVFRYISCLLLYIRPCDFSSAKYYLPPP